jgi:hypothetical protein
VGTNSYAGALQIRPSQSDFPTGGKSLPDESDPNFIKKLQSERTPLEGSNQLNATLSVQPKAWGRTDRIRLFIWVGIAFLLPGACVFAVSGQLSAAYAFFYNH